jgi:hypothetical protein
MSTFLYFFAPIFLTPSPSLLPPIAAQVDDAAVEAPAGDAPEGEAAEGEAPEGEAEAAEVPTAEETAAQAARSDQTDAIAAQLRQREDIRGVHRALGIATWISLAAAVVTGGLQFHDEYGGSEFETPCARLQPVVSQDFCFNSPPMPMLVTGVISSLLYYTTFALSFAMPDPLGVAESPGWAGERLRIHKALRWAHLAAMIATTLFGVIAANLPQPPSDDAVSYEVRQALAAVHLGLGVTTYALVTAAGLVILF